MQTVKLWKHTPRTGSCLCAPTLGRLQDFEVHDKVVLDEAAVAVIPQCWPLSNLQADLVEQAERPIYKVCPKLALSIELGAKRPSFAEVYITVSIEIFPSLPLNNWVSLVREGISPSLMKGKVSAHQLSYIHNLRGPYHVTLQVRRRRRSPEVDIQVL